jgi:hypothetical protein
VKKLLKILLIILSGIFIIIQFIPYGKPINQPSRGNDIFEMTELPKEVGTILKNTCYDCHSQLTKFPWYSSVAPISWLVASDINEGREHLDFSKWGDLSKKDKLKVLDKISEEVVEENMPLKKYSMVHSEARLTKTQRDIVVKWADGLAENIFEE